jgi:hypothetical protein
MTPLSNNVGSKDAKDLESNAFRQKFLGRKDVDLNCNKFMNVSRVNQYR